jgi:Putative MetA-pathway of phenol degradation
MNRGAQFKIAISFIVGLFSLQIAGAQDLVPRAYVITPLHANAVTLGWTYFHGGLDFNGVVNIENASGTFSVPTITLYHSFNLLGRSANIAAGLPYGVGTFQGEAGSTQLGTYRSGLLDAGFRLSVNLMGGPAMSIPQFAKWKQKTLLGVSLRLIAPTGQYDPDRRISWSANRWAFKPELGYSRRLGDWILDGYAGVWFFTTNPASFSAAGPQPQSESPIGSFEGHLSYNLKPFLWVALDGNFWLGGTTSLNGLSNPNTRQTSSRIGTTVSIPLTRKQSLKLSYGQGVYSRFGSDYRAVSIAWQYAWIGKPN